MEESHPYPSDKGRLLNFIFHLDVAINLWSCCSSLHWICNAGFIFNSDQSLKNMLLFFSCV